MRRCRESVACLATVILVAGCSSRQNIEPAFRHVLHATHGDVYSATMPGGTLKLPKDAPWVVLEFAPTATGRALTASELQTLVSYLERVDRLEPSSDQADCASMSTVFARLSDGSRTVDVGIDPDCGHVQFTDASKGKGQMLWMGDLGKELKSWAREIDPIAMTPKQP